MTETTTKQRRRIAEGKPVDEYLKMKVGDVVEFDISKYNYNSLRSLKASSQSLINERIKNHKDWSVRANFEKGYALVTRIR